MAEETTSGEAPKAPSPSKLPMLLALLNSVALLGAGGFFIYTQILFKRPAITESTERERIKTAYANPPPAPERGYVPFEQMTLNILPNPSGARSEEGSERAIEGKLHYATIAFNLEIKDASKRETIERVRGIFQDRLLTLMGRKAFHELSHVQGRYLLRSEIMDVANELCAKSDPELTEPLVSEVYFTQFIIQ